MINIRTGIGYDVHKFKTGLKLIIGGVEIPHFKGCIAHSDGDVLIHAICDSLLGAANLRDIGFHFPDTDEKYKNIDSKLLLTQCVELLNKNNWKIENIDCIISLEKPKILNYIPKMQEIIAPIVNTGAVSIKATTSEKLGFIGNEEGIAAWASCLIYKI